MKALLLLLFLVFFSDLAKADTIDFYHVYYNTAIIRKYNLHDINDSSNVIILKRDSLRESDVLSINYRSDNGCSPCTSFIGISSINGVQLGEFYSNNNYFDIPMNTFLPFIKMVDTGLFKIKYTLDLPDGPRFSYILFYVKIE